MRLVLMAIIFTGRVVFATEREVEERSLCEDAWADVAQNVATSQNLDDYQLWAEAEIEKAKAENSALPAFEKIRALVPKLTIPFSTDEIRALRQENAGVKSKIVPDWPEMVAILAHKSALSNSLTQEFSGADSQVDFSPLVLRWDSTPFEMSIVPKSQEQNLTPTIEFSRIKITIGDSIALDMSESEFSEFVGRFRPNTNVTKETLQVSVQKFIRLFIGRKIVFAPLLKLPLNSELSAANRGKPIKFERQISEFGVRDKEELVRLAESYLKQDAVSGFSIVATTTNQKRDKEFILTQFMKTADGTYAIIAVSSTSTSLELTNIWRMTRKDAIVNSLGVTAQTVLALDAKYGPR